MHDKYVIRAGCCLVLSVRVVIQEFFAMVSKVLIVCAFLLYELSGASRNDGRGGAMEAGGVGGVLRNHIYTSGVRQQNSTNELQVGHHLLAADLTICPLALLLALRFQDGSMLLCHTGLIRWSNFIRG